MTIPDGGAGIWTWVPAGCCCKADIAAPVLPALRSTSRSPLTPNRSSRRLATPVTTTGEPLTVEQAPHTGSADVAVAEFTTDGSTRRWGEVVSSPIHEAAR